MHLKKGNTIGILAPAGFLKESESIDNSIELLQSWGLKVKLGKHVFNKHNHFAGTDLERIADFQNFLDDENIHAIWCARGGYGSIRIIDKLDFSKFIKNPKWIIGYSDITVFHLAVQQLKQQSVHSFMPTSIKTLTNAKNAVTNFKNILFGKQISYNIKPNPNNKLGKVTAKIIGGNLSILNSLTGTKYGLKPKNHILFIEEIGEYKYNIDRMLHTLELNGYFKNCVGLIVGSFTNIPKNTPSFNQSIPKIILHFTAKYNFPVCFDFPAGHIANNNPILFGKKAVLNIQKNMVTLNF